MMELCGCYQEREERETWIWLLIMPKANCGFFDHLHSLMKGFPQPQKPLVEKICAQEWLCARRGKEMQRKWKGMNIRIRKRGRKRRGKKDLCHREE